MVIGYGFGDEQVNGVIADAIEHHDLRIFIWITARIRGIASSRHLWPISMERSVEQDVASHD